MRIRMTFVGFNSSIQDQDFSAQLKTWDNFDGK